VADVLSKSDRAKNMRAIRGKDTNPELMVRRYLHNMGYRYRLHDGSLPGKPDIVFASRRKVVFVNGCFWHSHSCRFGQVQPSTNAQFWSTKRSRTIERDLEQRLELERRGWTWFDLWECETRKDERWDELLEFLGPRLARGSATGKSEV